MTLMEGGLHWTACTIPPTNQVVRVHLRVVTQCGPPPRSMPAFCPAGLEIGSAPPTLARSSHLVQVGCQVTWTTSHRIPEPISHYLLVPAQK